MSFQQILIKESLIEDIEKELSMAISSAMLVTNLDKKESLNYIRYLLDAFENLENNIHSVVDLRVIDSNKDFLDIYDMTLKSIENVDDQELVRAYRFVLGLYYKLVCLDKRTNTEYSIEIYHKNKDEYETVKLTKEDFDKFSGLATMLLEDYGCLTNLGLSRKIIPKENK